MSDHSNATLREIIRNAEQELATLDPSPFSPAGFVALKESIANYIDSLVSESIRTSRRARADTVSAAHVDEATQYLVNSSGRRLFRHLGMIGGLLLGTGLSQLVTMISDGHYTETGVAVSVAFGVIGTFLVALHIAKD